MSWLDKIKDKLQITTADGQDYKPDWLNATLQTEYKYTDFNFVEVPGSFVKRKKAIGRKYSLEIYFQGSNHLQVAERFRNSCDNTEGPWILYHPIYDIMKVQPTTLLYDNTNVNRTKVSGTVIETLEEPPQNNYSDPIDLIPILVESCGELSIKSLTVTPVPGDINTMAENTKTAYNKGVPIITDALDFEAYFNAFNTANAYIDSATATPLLAMRYMISAIQLPAQFAAGVEQRVKVLIDTFNSLRANLFGVVDKSSKQIFTGQQSALLTAMCNSASTPLNSDYVQSSSILGMIDKINGRYAQFVDDVDSLQNDNGGNPLSFVADAELLQNLSQLVHTTITSLFNIALNSKQERAFVCEKDTNLILIAHRVYGLNPLDAEINQLIDNNDITLDEYLIIPKGRKILYYI